MKQSLHNYFGGILGIRRWIKMELKVSGWEDSLKTLVKYLSNGTITKPSTIHEDFATLTFKVDNLMFWQSKNTFVFYSSFAEHYVRLYNGYLNRTDSEKVLDDWLEYAMDVDNTMLTYLGICEHIKVKEGKRRFYYSYKTHEAKKLYKFYGSAQLLTFLKDGDTFLSEEE
jgi:hypothetical protein